MTTTYNWTVAELESNTADGGVITAHWRVAAQDGEHTASAYGSVGFTPDPTAEGFIPFDQLTEADVLGWVWGGGVDKDAVEAQLAAQIDARKTPVTQTGLPWA